MRYPEFINKNETIGFVSPSFGCATEPYKTAFENSLLKWKELGYGTDIGENCYKTDGIGRSSTPENCGKEFMEYYLSENNKILISCGGGELMCEMLDYVDFEKLKGAKPKWFMGYSDNTNMTFLLTTLCDVASVYGPCSPAFGMEPWHKAIADAKGVLTGEISAVSNYDKWEKESLKTPENPLEAYNTTEPTIIKKFPDKDAEMSGRLLGGCLDCLVNLAGTKYDKVKKFVKRYENDGIIWFLESCDLNVMSIRRAVWELDSCGWFENSKGFIVGRPYYHGQEMMGMNQYNAVLGILDKYNVPVVMDTDIGHLAPMMPLVTGSMAYVRARGNSLDIKMEYR